MLLERNLFSFKILLGEMDIRHVPSRLTMYRPRNPVAPNTVTVCPVSAVSLTHFLHSGSTIPPKDDL
jgi:hypothetical protein